MPTPDYMTDCPECGAQVWRLDSHTETQIRVVCTRCDTPVAFALDADHHGTDCLQCNTDTWSVAETRDDHVMLDCVGCKERTEIWLRNTSEIA